MARYEKGLNSMKELLNIDLDDSYNMIPESSLSHFVTEGTWPPQ